MKNSFMLNTFNSLKDAMVDALKTPDWWVYATLIAIFVLLITAIIIIVNCAKKSKKEKDAIDASPIETSIEVNTVNEASSINEKLENDTSAEVKIEKASTKTTRTQKSSTSKTSTNSASKMDETKKEETADEKKSSETISKPKRTPKVKSIADAVTSDTKKPTSTTTRRTTTRTTSTTTKSSTKSTK